MKLNLKLKLFYLLMIFNNIINTASVLPEPEIYSTIATINAIMKAASTGNLDALQFILKQDQNLINCVDINGKMALHHAAENNQANIIDYLIKFEALKIEQEDHSYKTALMLAVEKNNINAINAILKADKKQKKKIINLRDFETGATPLIRAAQLGSSEIINILLKNNANPLITLYKTNLTVLEIANRRIRSPIDYMTINAIEHAQQVWQYKQRDTLDFMHDVMQDKFEAAESLIKFIDVDAHDQDYNTPLIYACLKKQSNLVKLLIDEGADVNVSNDVGTTPLHIAIKNRDSETIKILIDSKAKINEKTERTSITPLHLALRTGNNELVKKLIDLSANINDSCTNGRTPLFIAVSTLNVEGLKILIDSYASLDLLTDAYGENAIKLAQKTADSDILKSRLNEILKMLNNSGRQHKNSCCTIL